MNRKLMLSMAALFVCLLLGVFVLNATNGGSTSFLKAVAKHPAGTSLTTHDSSPAPADAKSNGEVDPNTAPLSEVNTALVRAAEEDARASEAKEQSEARRQSELLKAQIELAQNPTSIAHSKADGSISDFSTDDQTVVIEDPDQPAKDAIARVENGESITLADKALIEAYEVAHPRSEFRPNRDNSLDDNGGTYFTWSGAARVPTSGTGGAGGSGDSTVIGLTVSGLPPVMNDVEVYIDTLIHTYVGDLEFRLVSPTGTQVLLIDNRGTSGDNFIGTHLDDEATTLISAGTAPFTNNYRPEQPLSAFDGQNPNGTWYLRVNDISSGDTGMVRCAGIY